jgi:hypothetical protein
LRDFTGGRRTRGIPSGSASFNRDTPRRLTPSNRSQSASLLTKGAVAEAYDRYFAGPAAAGEVIWLVRHYWLAFDALNRDLGADERVAPPVALLGWLGDAPKEYTRLLTCLPYWPIGLDAAGRWC